MEKFIRTVEAFFTTVYTELSRIRLTSMKSTTSNDFLLIFMFCYDSRRLFLFFKDTKCSLNNTKLSQCFLKL